MNKSNRTTTHLGFQVHILEPIPANLRNSKTRKTHQLLAKEEKKQVDCLTRESYQQF